MNRDKIKGLVLGFSATFCWASFYIVSRYFFGTDSDGLANREEILFCKRDIG